MCRIRPCQGKHLHLTECKLCDDLLSLGAGETVKLCALSALSALSWGVTDGFAWSTEPVYFGDYPIFAGVAMRLTSASAGRVRRNMRIMRTKRTKWVGRELMGKNRSPMRSPCQVCGGIGILSAEGNAAPAAGCSDGMDYQGNGHGI